MPVISTVDPGTLSNAPQVSVTVGPITGDNNGKFVEEGLSSATWDDYYITNRYEKSFGRFMMGTTSPDGYTFQGNKATVAFAQLYAPTVLWIADFTCMRTGEKPTIPSELIPNQSSQAGKWILLNEHLEPGMIFLSSDGETPIYRISGTYVYGHTAPQEFLNRDINFPRPPWMDNTFDRTVPDEMFENSLINTGNVG